MLKTLMSIFKWKNENQELRRKIEEQNGLIKAMKNEIVELNKENRNLLESFKEFNSNSKYRPV